MPGPAPVLLKTIIVLPRKSSNPFEKCKKKIHKEIGRKKTNIKIRIKLKIKDFCHWPLLIPSYLKNCKSYSNSVKKTKNRHEFNNKNQS